MPRWFWIGSKLRRPPRRGDDASTSPSPTQGLLWAVAPYQEDAPAITSARELAGAIEHLHYAVFRRYANQLTRAERSRLDNTIDNALFKIDRYLIRARRRPRSLGTRKKCAACALSIRDGRERLERQARMARRADLKLAQLASLSAESFEEFVGELFEMLGYEVEQVGGSGDEGADLRLRRNDGLSAVVQCKYHKQAVVGSPALQKIFGHDPSHPAATRDSSSRRARSRSRPRSSPPNIRSSSSTVPRLVELVSTALGPKAPPRKRTRLVLKVRPSRPHAILVKQCVDRFRIIERVRNGMRLASRSS